jgi:sugar lactone lactonase YvrE
MVKTFRSVAGILLFALVLILPGVLSTPSEAATPMLYITNSGNQTISRGNLDGTGGVSLGDLGGTLNLPAGIALDEDNSRMYIANCTGGTLSVSALDGTGGVDLGNLGGLLDSPVGIAIDPVNDKMYVVNQTNSNVVRANLDGTGATDLGDLNVTINGSEGLALDVANNLMYVVNHYDSTISRANLDGTGGVSLGNLNGTLNGPYGIALDLVNNRMYVANMDNDTISRANLDGTGGVSLGNLNGTLCDPAGIALDVANNRMYVSNGCGTITQANLDGTGGVSLGNYDGTVEAPRLIAIKGLGVTQTMTVRSAGMYDGWILESSENSSLGGTLDATGGTLNLGDGRGDKQYRAILSFDTSALPDDAMLTKVTLKIHKMSVIGTNPFTILGGLKVDLRKPFFGTSVGLLAGDFEAAAGKPNAATFRSTAVSNWYTAVIGLAGYPYINLTGKTQMRLRFMTGDDDDFTADTLVIHSGNAATSSYRPKLTINYLVP